MKAGSYFDAIWLVCLFTFVVITFMTGFQPGSMLGVLVFVGVLAFRSKTVNYGLTDDEYRRLLNRYGRRSIEGKASDQGS